MSTGIRMAFVMNLLLLLFSEALVRSDQSMLPLKSFKINENVTYDCIDIYKQPGLDHPLLKNHAIQMKPSVSRHEIKNQTGNNEAYKRELECSDGTVPILKNTKESIANAQFFNEKQFHPLTVDSPGTHIAGLRSSRQGPFRGIESRFNAYNLNVEKDQASYSEIYVGGSGLNNQVNYISAGLMINPSIFGDRRVWSYGFWKGKNGTGCYNTVCPGFVQVSREVPIVGARNLKPGEPTWLHCSIHQDQETGNWWLTIQRLNARREIDVGYWPKELFNVLGNGASMVGVGGVVQASRSGSSPPMGNGKFPNGGTTESSLFANIELRDSHYYPRRINYYPFDKLLDSTKCYGLRLGKFKVFHENPLGFFFNYGGPGGNSCGA